MGKIWTIPQPAMIAREEHLPPHIKNLFSMIKTDELVFGVMARRNLSFT